MMKTAATLSALTALAATTTTTTGNVVVMAEESYDSYSSYDNKYGGVDKYGKYGGYTDKYGGYKDHGKYGGYTDKYGGYDDYGYGTYPKYSFFKPWTWKYKNSYNYYDSKDDHYDPHESDHHHYANLEEAAHKLIGVQEEKIVEDRFDFRTDVGFDEGSDGLSELFTDFGTLSVFARQNLPQTMVDTMSDTAEDRAFNVELAKTMTPTDYMTTAFQGADDQSLCTCYCDPGKVSIGCHSEFVNNGHHALHGMSSAISDALENALSLSALKSRYVPVKKHGKSDKFSKFGYDETTFTGISQTIFSICLDNVTSPPNPNATTTTTTTTTTIPGSFFPFNPFSLLNLQTTLQGSIAPFKAGDAQVVTQSSTSIIWSYQGLIESLFNAKYPIMPFVQTRKYGSPTCNAPQNVLDQCNSVCSDAFNRGRIPKNQFSEKCGLEPATTTTTTTTTAPPM